MKTPVIATALLAIMFAGCSKDETADLNPATSDPQEVVRRPYTDNTLVGTYTVLKYTIDGQDAYNELKDLKLYVYKSGLCETVVMNEHEKGTYKYDPTSHIVDFEISGNSQTNILASREWNLSRRDNRQVSLFSDEGNIRIVFYLNYPVKASPL